MDRPTGVQAAAAALFPGLTDDPLWYKDAIIYELHVKAFFDSTNDGMGDFTGLTQKLDYLRDLGVNTLWLLPFYPSPMRDDGYDISDYRNISTDYGTRQDFRNFVREAHRRGLRVITELVINHTSDQHPWFQAARRAPPGSAKRNFYVWSDTAKKFEGTRIIFTDSETSNWAWDKEAKAYYWHRFFSHQPDLNHNNPDVVRAVIRVMRFWLDAGVDGLRLDAIPYLCVREGTSNENLPETHAVIKQMRRVIDANYKNRMLLAEANQWPEDVREYFGEGDECHMAYHFPLMPRMYMAVAQEDRHPIIEIMRQTPDIPDNCQWAIFLRNHDELTLEMVTNRERDYMYKMYAADPRMRVNVGIRRRLAPLMENDRDRIDLLMFMLMTMPGSPILYYGDEIGMGDNIFLGDRNGVRTPMQWSPDRNAGFSRADPQRLYLPPIMDAIYGYEALNVESQSRGHSSLLNWTKRLIAVRKKYRAFGRGSLKFLEPGNRKILAYVREYEDEVVLCVINLSRHAQPVELDLSAYKGRVPVEILGRTPFPPIGDLPYLSMLKGHGFYAFRLAADAEVPYWHEERLARRELPVLVLMESWRSFFIAKHGASNVRRALSVKSREQLDKEVLEPYIASKRWFAAKGHRIERVEIVEEGVFQSGEGAWLVALIEVHCADIDPQTYFLPLELAWEDEVGEGRIEALSAWTLAKVRQKARLGILFGAFGDAEFCRALATAMGTHQEIEFGTGKLIFKPTRAFDALAPGLAEEVLHPGLEQSNTGVFFGNKLFLKGYRRLQPGVNPEVEVGRFLTEASPFTHIAAVAGSVDYQAADGTVMTLALLQAFVENQGTGWFHTLEYLERFLSERSLSPEDTTVAQGESPHGFFMALIETLGRRTAEMHQAFARTTGDAAFDPEPVTAAEASEWVEQVRRDAVATLDRLEACRAGLPERARELSAQLLARREQLLESLQAGLFEGIDAIKTRYHGDYHLGQVLLVENDFVITDFEGEPARPLAERHRKHSALRDVAGMLRSFNYAAYAALTRVSAGQPSDLALLEPMAHAWERETRAAFLHGYHAAIIGFSSWPRSPQHGKALIDLFLVEKALYELRYELDNRPDWAYLPQAGLLEILANAEEGASDGENNTDIGG